MEDQGLPKPVGEMSVSPSKLKPPQEDLCVRMDSLHSYHRLKSKPSDMFKGAVFASHERMRNNPDWLAQAANSLRDIIYPFNGKKAPKQEKALEEFGSINTSNDKLRQVFGTLTQLAHHGNGKGNLDYENYSIQQFEKLVEDFESAMSTVLIRQPDVHAEIDSLFEDK